MKIFPPINVKMPTIVCILPFMNRKNSILGLSEPEKCRISWYFHTYENLKFHAQPSWAWNKFFNLGTRVCLILNSTNAVTVWGNACSSQTVHLHVKFAQILPYFFNYKMDFFSFQYDPKHLKPSCKMALDLWNCLGRVKFVLQQNFIGLT